MSLSYQQLNAVEVRDPRTIVQTQRDYAVLKAGSQTTWKPFSSPSVSNSSIQWSCPPPSGAVFVDSKVYVYIPVRITLTGSPGTSLVASTILREGLDAPRAYPISGSIDTLSATINNQSVNINLADIIHAISHFNTDEDLLNGDYSTFPNYPDQAQTYESLRGANRSPLAAYADGIDGSKLQRGAYPYVIVANPPSNGTPVTAIIDISFCEPIFLPPFYFGSSNRQAFYNVNTMDFNFTFLGQMANRMWSHCPVDAGIAGTPNLITASSATFGGVLGGPTSALPGGLVPLMLIQYITPQETQIISPLQPLTYPYFDIQRYPTQGGTFTAGFTDTIASNNIQLSSIPRRMYIFVRDSNSSLYASPSLTDTFFKINNLSIQFMNKSGLLASASIQQLYLMSRKNHCNMNWTQWSGGPSLSPGVNGTLSISTIGSIICIEFATDIGLDSLDAPGKLGQYMVQVNVNVTNISNRTITPTMYLVPILEGTFTIPELGRAMLNIGVITSQDILDAQSKPMYSYADVEAVSGGDFFSGIKNFFTQKVLPHLKSFVNNQGISKTLGLIPHPAAQIASRAANALGYGNEMGGVRAGEGMHNRHHDHMQHMHHGHGEGLLLPDVGGVYAGEGKMSKKALSHRMKHY